jgi:hypothetical protein
VTEDLAHLRRADPPQWVEPMLATLTDERFSHADWLSAANLFRRLARRTDPWAGIARHARPLPHDSRHPA